MAQYTKRGKGWQARIQWRDSFGKRHTKSKSGFKTKALAKKWAITNEEQLNIGLKIDRAVSLADYYEHWINTYKQDKVAEVTMQTYLTLGKDLRDYFGNTGIKNITRMQYQEFINGYGKDHAPTSVQKINGFIRSCVQSAILDDYLTKDFTQGVALGGNKNLVVKVQYLNIKEIKALLHAANTHLTPHFTSRYMIITAIYTGMRLSEIQALTWKDIDFQQQTISINKSWNFHIRQFKATKNPSSVRTIRVNPELLALLSQLRSNRASTMVFTNQYGTIPTSNAVNKTLRKLLNELNIHKRNFHFHSLRHSHVALLLANGIDIYAISKRLGHSNIKTTANTYAYLIDEYKDQTDKQIISALSVL